MIGGTLGSMVRRNIEMVVKEISLIIVANTLSLDGNLQK